MKPIIEMAREVKKVCDNALINNHCMSGELLTCGVLANAVLDLSEALEEIAKQPYSTEMSTEQLERADFDCGYGGCIQAARAALEKHGTKEGE